MILCGTKKKRACQVVSEVPQETYANPPLKTEKTWQLVWSEKPWAVIVMLQLTISLSIDIICCRLTPAHLVKSPKRP